MKQSEFELWRNNSDTKKVLQIVSDELKYHAEALVTGAVEKESMEATGAKYISEVSYINGLRFILENIVSYLEEDDKDENNIIRR